MTLIAFRPRWRIGRHPSCTEPSAPAHAIDVLSGVSFSMQPMCRCERRPSASALHFSVHLGSIVLYAIVHLHARAGVHPHAQMACPERAMPLAWLAFTGRPAVPCAAPPGHRIPVPSGRGMMQGKIEGCGTKVRTKSVCTWGWRGTRYLAAPCRQSVKGPISLDATACMPRHGPMACAGVTP